MSLDGVLLVIFLTLKLSGAVTWSWIWVLSPLWINLLWLGIRYLYSEYQDKQYWKEREEIHRRCR